MSISAPPNEQAAESALCVKDVAGALNVSPMTVYRLLARGAIDGFMVGRYVRVTAESLAEFRRRNRIRRATGE